MLATLKVFHMSVFRFKHFNIHHEQSFKVGTDGVLLGTWATIEKCNMILDIGSGCGLIPLILAQRTSSTQIIGVEIDKQATQEALKNIDESPWADRVKIVNDTVQAFAAKQSSKFDFIISNPPYFINSTKSTKKQQSTARHTDTLPFEDLLDATNKLLSSEGKLAVVLPKEEGEIFISLALEKGFHLTRLTEVRSKKRKPIARLLMEFERIFSVLVKDELLLQNETHHDYTIEYKHLTRDFYLNH
jgi:tRNA1Val (adenine37-N6)-methyltransferase